MHKTSLSRTLDLHGEYADGGEKFGEPWAVGPATNILSPDARDGTPQLKTTCPTAEPRHHIILGLANNDLRDAYHNDGHYGVQRVLSSKQFAVVPDVDPEDWQFLAKHATQGAIAAPVLPPSQKPPRLGKPRKGRKDKAAGTAQSNVAHPGMPAGVTSEGNSGSTQEGTSSSSAGEEAETRGASEKALGGVWDGSIDNNAEDPKPLRASARRKFPVKSDPHSSIFKVLAYKTITRDGRHRLSLGVKLHEKLHWSYAAPFPCYLLASCFWQVYA